LSIVNIHPDFKLQGQSFKDEMSLLSFVKIHFEVDYLFINDLFKSSASIKVATSGSTGKPKTIDISKKAMLYSATATGQFFDLPAKSRALHCLSSDYIAGKMMWVRALHLGWHLEVVKPDSKPLSHTKTNFDFAAMVPLQVQNSLTDLHRINKLIIGGAAVSYSLEQALKNRSTSCYQTYGMTETITHIAVKRIGTKKTFYKTLPEVSISQDNRDCLIIDAPNISEKPILTNDIVRLHSETEFEWLGRYDNIINSGGVKLFPEQIEAKLAAFIKFPFFVGSLPDEKLGEKLVLLIESDQPKLNIEKLLLKANVSKYEMPKEVYYLPNFVRTKNDKINRNDTILNINQ